MQATDRLPLGSGQPEDELDNRFLFGTILPVLKNLNGRRRVIVAAHDAYIVVNGDADLVIELEATTDRGCVANAGTIMIRSFATLSCAPSMVARRRSSFDRRSTDSEVSTWNG